MYWSSIVGNQSCYGWCWSSLIYGTFVRICTFYKFGVVVLNLNGFGGQHKFWDLGGSTAKIQGIPAALVRSRSVEWVLLAWRQHHPLKIEISRSEWQHKFWDLMHSTAQIQHIQGVPVLVCQTKLGDRDHRSKKILSKDPCPEMNRLASRRM